jgi:hypothetical protein
VVVSLTPAAAAASLPYAAVGEIHMSQMKHSTPSPVPDHENSRERITCSN